MIRIFVSYSQEDFKPEARFLKNYLSRHLSDSDIFIDQMISKGTQWRRKIESKLKECNIFIVILTTGALESTEIKKEVKMAIDKSDRVIIPCKDEYLKTDWDEIPWNLSSFNGLDFEQKEELARKLVGEIKELKEKKIIEKSSYLQDLSKLVSSSVKGFFPMIPGSDFGFNYFISNGWIKSAGFDRDAMSVHIRLSSIKKSKLKLWLPKKLIDAKLGSKDDRLFVLIEGEEIDKKETITNEERILEFECQKGENQIEILGTQILSTSFEGSVKKRNIIKISNGLKKFKTANLLEPKKHVIRAGEKIRWINEDSDYHTITSGTPSGGPDGTFDSSTLSPNLSFEITFNQEGIFDYFDMIHPWIVGRIIVK